MWGSLGQLTSVERETQLPGGGSPVVRRVDYAHDSSGRVVSTWWPSGAISRSLYAGSWLTGEEVELSSGTHVFGRQYDPRGLLSRVARTSAGTSLEVELSWPTPGLLGSVSVTWGGGTTSSLSYTYGPNGWLSQKRIRPPLPAEAYLQ